MKNYLLSILILICSTAYSQEGNISSKTSQIVKKIKKVNTYETAFLPEKTNSKQLELFDQLKVVATEHELKLLTKHKNGVVRVYALSALEERNSTGLLDIVISHINDKEVIDCISYGYEFVHTVIRKTTVAEKFVRCNSLTSQERFLLDSILIYSDNKLTYTQYMLEGFETISSYYPQIKKLVEKDLNKGATIALAKYQNKNDLALIEKRIIQDADMKYTHTAIDIEDAIEYFPDEYFKNTLNELKEKNKWHYYSASAVFRDSFSVNYLNSSLDQPSKNKYYREQKIKGIYKAIEKYKTPLYDSILFRIWEDDYFINDSLLTYLLSVDSTKCEKLAFKSLQKPDEIDNSNLVLVDLLNFIISVNKDNATQIISNKLKTVSVHEFRYFSEASKKVDYQKVSDALLERYKGESNGHICIPIVEAILSFKNDELNNQLLVSIRTNKELNGWGLEKVKSIIESEGLKI
tara:strand:+ start:4014 stop:5405 length:1392 start_codon:yes stop_codon:yes gene_type:complete